MTAHLWKSEQNGNKLLYIDLFESLDSSYFSKLDKQLEALRIKHSSTMDKCNNKSSAFMHEASQFSEESSHYRAIEAYTKALRFAEIGTENVSMAFLSRAHCFNQLKLFDQALIDVKLAIESHCPPNVLSQLKNLQDIYMQQKMSVESTNQSFEEPMRRLDFEANKHFPCLANVLTIQNNNQFGRHIVAKCDIDVGQNVLMEESFASVNRSIDHVCYTCLAESKNFIPCPKCTDVVFCNQKCMESNEVHKLDCQTMFHRMPHKVQFIIRTILMAVTAFPDIDSLMASVNDTISSDDSPDSVSDIQSKYRLYLKLKRSELNDNALLDVCDLFKLSMAVSTIRELFKTDREQRFLVHLLLHHLAVNVNNGYDSETTTSIGAVLCLFNHSCAPNLYNYAVGNQKYCVTIRPVKKGEQLFISYLGKCEDQSTQQRQHELKMRWNFDCKCDRCEPRRVDNNKMRQDSCFKFVYRHFKSDPADFMNTILLKKKCIKFLQKYGHLPFSNELDFIASTYTTLI